MKRYQLITQALLVTAGGLILLSLMLDIITMMISSDTSPQHNALFILHIFIMILLLLFAVFLRRWMLPHLLLPIDRIHEWANNVDTGNFTYTLKAVGSREIDELVEVLNRLAQDIARREVELRTINATLNARSQELTQLSRQTIAVEEEERRRVSRELHDGLSQVMGAAKMTLDVAARITDIQKKDDLLHEASKTVEQAIDELHNISQGLRPTILDDLGLKEALEWYTQYFEARYKITTECNFEDIGVLNLTSEQEITAYRFLQEALMNVYKHARASKITIKLRLQANFVMLSVTDDGVGFERSQPLAHQNRLSLGLTGLQERLALVGGELIIHSQTNKGTTLIALLPTSEAE